METAEVTVEDLSVANIKAEAEWGFKYDPKFLERLKCHLLRVRTNLSIAKHDAEVSPDDYVMLFNELDYYTKLYAYALSSAAVEMDKEKIFHFADVNAQIASDGSPVL